MSFESRSRAQWQEAFGQCQAHGRKMRRENDSLRGALEAAEARAAAAESARDAAEGVVREVRELAEDDEAVEFVMRWLYNGPDGHRGPPPPREILRDLEADARNALEAVRALLAPVTTDATEGGDVAAMSIDPDPPGVTPLQPEQARTILDALNDPLASRTCGTCEGYGHVALGWREDEIGYRKDRFGPCPDCTSTDATEGEA